MGVTAPERPVLEEKTVLTPGQKGYLRLKRVLDLWGALLALALLAPLLLLTVLALKAESPKAPAIFRQKRVGKDGKVFTIYKFRTMKSTAPRELATAEFLDAEAYITGVGRVLRRSSMDELPQLVNVLKGEMSLLGPRPLILGEAEIHALRREGGVYQVRPGLSGLAQIHGRDGLDAREKVRWDRAYVEHVGFGLDVSIFLRSILTVLSGQGILDRKWEKRMAEPGKGA